LASILPIQRHHDLEQLSRAELFSTRLCDLNLSVRGSWVEACLDELQSELKQRQLAIRPRFWLSTEWFTPASGTGIAVPFYLTHPRLMRLERTQMFEVDGGSVRNCMKILRHELGHVVQHAFRLHRRRNWQRTFGHSATPYPEIYRPDPTSQAFVRHLDNWYAQSHPDEDFAETFAVWLSPKSNWKRRYSRWPSAYRKLHYVDQLMKELARRKPTHTNPRPVEPLRSLTLTLADYYRLKRAHYRPDGLPIFDRQLVRIFPRQPITVRSRPAVDFLSQRRSKLRQIAVDQIGLDHTLADLLLDTMIRRSRLLKLFFRGKESEVTRRCAALLSRSAQHYTRRRQLRIPL